MKIADTVGECAQPPINVVDSNYDVIANLAIQIEHRQPELSAMLLNELNRAEIHSASSISADVVTLGSQVEFVDEVTGTRRRVQLVLPAEADIEAQRISVLSHVGAGLIGLSVGQSISWPYPDGRTRVLKVLEVEQTAEAND